MEFSLDEAVRNLEESKGFARQRSQGVQLVTLLLINILFYLKAAPPILGYWNGLYSYRDALCTKAKFLHSQTTICVK